MIVIPALVISPGTEQYALHGWLNNTILLDIAIIQRIHHHRWIPQHTWYVGANAGMSDVELAWFGWFSQVPLCRASRPTKWLPRTGHGQARTTPRRRAFHRTRELVSEGTPAILSAGALSLSAGRAEFSQAATVTPIPFRQSGSIQDPQRLVNGNQ